MPNVISRYARAQKRYPDIINALKNISEIIWCHVRQCDLLFETSYEIAVAE